jgi:hypothetical protein
MMECNNCGDKNGTKWTHFGGVASDAYIKINGIMFRVGHLSFCSKECLNNYFDDAIDTVSMDKCGKCTDDLVGIMGYNKLLCDDKGCPRVKQLNMYKMWDEERKIAGGTFGLIKKKLLGDNK